MFRLLDSQIVDELSEIMGDDLGMLFETFLVDSESKIVELVAQTNAQQSDVIRRIAHSLKGSSRNLGASQLAEQCELLENAARNAQSHRYSPLISAVNRAFLALKVEIESANLTH